ncbi:hypothetical protein FACS1894152_3150 [Bacilli bacterium]|nr:hypothetical protein FACS1894152_3150 [Bacilli bacterium]
MKVKDFKSLFMVALTMGASMMPGAGFCLTNKEAIKNAPKIMLETIDEASMYHLYSELHSGKGKSFVVLLAEASERSKDYTKQVEELDAYNKRYDCLNVNTKNKAQCAESLAKMSKVKFDSVQNVAIILKIQELIEIGSK